MLRLPLSYSSQNDCHHRQEADAAAANQNDPWRAYTAERIHAAISKAAAGASSPAEPGSSSGGGGNSGAGGGGSSGKAPKLLKEAELVVEAEPEDDGEGDPDVQR
jgi:hypothetical protein